MRARRERLRGLGRKIRAVIPVGKISDPACFVGKIFERRNGSRFLVERQDLKYVHYWLSKGSRPQFRSVAIENLRHYRMVGP